jgi:hypothetical protein
VARRARWRTRCRATTPGLKASGSTAGWRERMLDFDGLNGVIGTPQMLERGRRYD